jgi:hypothetical protein
MGCGHYIYIARQLRRGLSKSSGVPTFVELDAVAWTDVEGP